MKTGLKRREGLDKLGVSFEVASGYDLMNDHTEVRIMVLFPDEQLFCSYYKDGGKSIVLTKREVALGLRAIAKKLSATRKNEG